MTSVVHTVDELDAALAALRAQGKDIALVPTMGALHEGHLELVKRARHEADGVVVSIFVNPLQFSAGEDFDRYPRSLDKDVEKLDGSADVIFAPTPEVMYPQAQTSELSSGDVGDLFEGASRPGHFDGVLKAVSRLFELVQPQVAVFGQKDAQQVFVISRMVRSLFPDLRLVIVPTVREEDGLALSSRNVYLSESERADARVIPHALLAATHAARHSSAGDVVQAGKKVFEQYPLVRLEYLELVDPSTFYRVENDYTGEATLIVAAYVGQTRLIDTENLEIIHA
jgi:pantoate--beta-alanine ligase